jgi:hypothetical protein
MDELTPRSRMLLDRLILPHLIAKKKKKKNSKGPTPIWLHRSTISTGVKYIFRALIHKVPKLFATNKKAWRFQKVINNEH